MNSSKLLFPLCLFLFCSPPPVTHKHYLKPILEYTVLWGDSARVTFKQCSRNTPVVKNLFTPTSTQTDTMFADLIKTRQDLEKRLSHSLEEYRYQAVGFNTKFVYLNCFATVKTGIKDWRSSVIATCDTGSLYWGIVYNLEGRTFNQIHINGRKD